MADNATGPSRGVQIIVVGILALLCCGGILAGTAYLYFNDERDKPGMRAAAEAYLTAVVSGEYDTAYDLLCERDRREWQRATWKPTRGSTDPTGFRITKVAIERPGSDFTPPHGDRRNHACGLPELGGDAHAREAGRRLEGVPPPEAVKGSAGATPSGDPVAAGGH